MRAAIVLLVIGCLAAADHAYAQDNLRFAAVEIILSSEEPVAAWQFELDDRRGHMQVVGVENGDSEAFERAPYYDREAVQLGNADRIIVADYSVADVDALPVGKFRIATIHVALSGDADFDLQLITATTQDGKAIDASISIRSSNGSKP